MQIDRLPRRLWYRWTDGGVETEYGNNISTPPPEIKCDEVQVTVPPTLPQVFTIYATQPQWGSQTYQANAYVNQATSFAVPTIRYESYFSSGHCQVWIRFTNSNGSSYELGSSTSAIYICGSAYMTPGNSLKPRRDLLIGSDRIVNPTLEAPCPKWRFTGGNCPDGSIDCGNCCLDCASFIAGVKAGTAAVLPYSTWRPK